MTAALEYFVYAVLVDTPGRTLTKLGRASSVRQRLNEYVTCCPFAIRHVYACDVETREEGAKREARLHELYDDRKLRGEWFDVWGRIATQDDIDLLERDVYGIACEGFSGETRHFRCLPHPFSSGKVSLKKYPLDKFPEKVTLGEDGYPLAASYIASQKPYEVAVTHRKRRLFKKA
ncbi:GIY-YIG nuclease family protein [Dyella kyungheensis]|uniref:GIY-YIG nuclease family protein n=1 Tax=Dyella kyungheensis TaxID=1242174 RepID=UPI003CE9097A